MVEQYQWCTAFQSISPRKKRLVLIIHNAVVSILKMIVWISLFLTITFNFTMRKVLTKNPKRQFSLLHYEHLSSFSWEVNKAWSSPWVSKEYFQEFFTFWNLIIISHLREADFRRQFFSWNKLLVLKNVGCFKLFDNITLFLCKYFHNIWHKTKVPSNLLFYPEL